MKKWLWQISIVLMSLSLAACPGKKKDGGGGAVATTPPAQDQCQWNQQYFRYMLPNGNVCTPPNINSQNSCLNYRYDTTRYVFVDANNNVVQCVNTFYNFTSGNIVPYYWYDQNSDYRRGCSGWYYVFGAHYLRVRLGAGYVCMRSDLVFNAHQGFQHYYNQYPYRYYPVSCVTGVNCHQVCQTASGGAQLGPISLGGTLSLCQPRF